jgi:hypothetical protein
MRADDLTAEACAQTGLDDFGNESYREGLETLVAAIDDTARLNDLGAAALPAQIVGNLANRLAVVDWHSTHPDLSQQRIERPIVILGMPRTGTTFLSYLLDQDERVRSLMGWEAQHCVPPPTSATFRTDPRIAESAASKELMDTINPEFKAIHYEAPDGPTECVAVTAQDFKSVLWETIANVPAYGSWLLECDYTSAYDYHRQVLALLQSEAPGRWVLKSPGHRMALDALVAAYPDVLLVDTHRDPVRVVASVCSLVTSLSGTFTDADHRAYITQHWTDMLEVMMRRVDDFRARRPEISVVDVLYDDLVASPIETVDRIYRSFGEELPAGAEAAMAAYAEANRKGTHGNHAYALDELGLDRDELENRFGPYRERHGIPVEAVR